MTCMVWALQVIEAAQSVVNKLDDQTTCRLDLAATPEQRQLREVYGMGHQVR